MGLRLLNDQTTVEKDFREILEEISSTLFSLGVKVKPYHSPCLDHYSHLSNSQKKLSLSDSTKYLESLTASEFSKENEITEHPDRGEALWLALRFFGLRPTSDLFENLTLDDSIEVYNSAGIQIWRNLRFMEVCSYSLEEIFCYTWQERYNRSDEATNQIINLISKFSPSSPKSVHCQIKNVLYEVFSEKKLVIDVTHKLLSPVFNSANQVGGFVVASKVKIISNNN